MLACGMIVCTGLLAWSQSNNVTAEANTTDEIAMKGFSPDILAHNVKYEVVSVESFYHDTIEYLDYYGTGFVYDSEHIITARHIVEDAIDDPDNITIDVTTEYGITCVGYVIGSMEDLDIAVIKLYDSPNCFDLNDDDLEDVDDHGLMSVSVSSQGVDVGDWVMSAGYIDDYWPVYTVGVISHTGFASELISTDVIVHSAALGDGSSGSPVYDLYGNVIGMTYAGWSGEHRISLAHTIPIDVVYDAVEFIIRYSN